MDVSKHNVVERIARVLAGQNISANAQGDEESASRRVDAEWQDYLMDAVAVIKTMREPDARMAAAGDPVIWERMILAAIDETKPDTVTL
jgi:hypothetical protein